MACSLVGARSTRRSVDLEDIERYLDLFGWDKDEVSFARGYAPPRLYDLRSLKEQVILLSEAGEAESRPPWPMTDLSFDHPAVRQLVNAGGPVYSWDLYSTQVAFELAQIVLAGALDGYRRLVEEYFPSFAPRMQVSASLPARLTGVLVRSSPSPHWDRNPWVDWYLEPLPPGSQNEIDLRLGEEPIGQEHMLAVLGRLRSMRPEAAGWISPGHQVTYDLIGRTPAIKLTHELLWDDLRRVSWVEGAFNRVS